MIFFDLWLERISVAFTFATFHILFALMHLTFSSHLRPVCEFQTILEFHYPFRISLFAFLQCPLPFSILFAFATLTFQVLFDYPTFGWINFQFCLSFQKIWNTSYLQSLLRLGLFCTFTDVGAYRTLSDVAKRTDLVWTLTRNWHLPSAVGCCQIEYCLFWTRIRLWRLPNAVGRSQIYRSLESWDSWYKSKSMACHQIIGADGFKL